MKSSCKQFACPQVACDHWTPTAITVAYGVTAVAMLLERKHEEILRRTDGLLDLLQGWLATKIDFETAWDVSFGRVLRALESDEVDAVDALVEVALRTAAKGHPARWRATLCEERRLCWDGCWLLPSADEISLDSNGTRATLDLKSPVGRRSSRTVIHHDEHGWLTDGERLIQVTVHRPITLFTSEAVPRDMIVEDDFHSIFEFPPLTPAMAQPFAAALEILDRHAPEYLGWVESVLRGILVCRCRESRTRSSSWMHAPGIILVSWSANPIDVAEMLVHESCHQYYYVASRLGAAVDDSDTQQYYSPAVQRPRPLAKILMGYHAFANVLLFYRALLRNGFATDAYCRSMEARLSAEVETLEQPLRNNSALTTIGRDLCQPLMEQLRESCSSHI